MAKTNPEFQSLPVLPLKNTILFPGLLLPLSVGRESSVKAVEAALKTEEKEIILVAQRDPQLTSATGRSLYDRNKSSHPEIIPSGRWNFGNSGPRRRASRNCRARNADCAIFGEVSLVRDACGRRFGSRSSVGRIARLASKADLPGSAAIGAMS